MLSVSAPPPDPAATALARAITLRDRPGAELDRALSLFVRRARVYDEPVERMLARLKELLHASVRPLRPDDDPREVVALLMRRAITAYYRDD
ncbi:hypothetical protein [Roseisolibacter sp. H3M3-2]|uniref:hypothetical protein n=1 Tax=Roseisolibacter sp. H3M3-2 TaxID=3031323 RepID=UPI0023DC63CB|nr:hypothetical protein [Roseisolibacter sp. H3M3-2]MDF1503509.1 hypothetical protein [Roseisolibacter sp. H3M3-2]